MYTNNYASFADRKGKSILGTIIGGNYDPYLVQRVRMNRINAALADGQVPVFDAFYRMESRDLYDLVIPPTPLPPILSTLPFNIPKTLDKATTPSVGPVQAALNALNTPLPLPQDSITLSQNSETRADVQTPTEPAKTKSQLKKQRRAAKALDINSRQNSEPLTRLENKRFKKMSAAERQNFITNRTPADVEDARKKEKARRQRRIERTAARKANPQQ